MAQGAFPRRVADEWVVVREMETELLVYDTRAQRVTALNPLAAAIWRRCDGATPPPDIALALRTAGMDTATPRAVDQALADLSAAELVEVPEGSPVSPPRRRLLRRLIGGGAVAAVVSVVAPLPVHAASSGDCPDGCPDGSSCFEGECREDPG